MNQISVTVNRILKYSCLMERDVFSLSDETNGYDLSSFRSLLTKSEAFGTQGVYFANNPVHLGVLCNRRQRTAKKNVAFVCLWLCNESFKMLINLN